MKYRLLALDLDGTILSRDLRIHPADRAAVAEAVSAGVHVIACTGRPFPAAVPWHRALGLRDPMICYQGAQVREPDGATLLDRGVDHELAMEVVRECRARDLEVHVYRDDRLLTERDRAEVRLYAEHSGMDLNLVPDLDQAMGPTTPKVVTVSDEQAVAALLPDFSERWRGRLTVSTSLPNYLEMTSSDADKAAALEFLSQRLGVDPAAAIAVGDGRNDAGMLRWAGLGVAIEGSPPEVREAAQRTIAPPASGAIASLLVELGIAKPALVRRS